MTSKEKNLLGSGEASMARLAKRSRAGWLCLVHAWATRRVSTPGVWACEGSGPKPRRRGSGSAHCRALTLAPGCVASYVRAAMIGSPGEPRPLSCSPAGSSDAAIFVDVSVPRGFRATARGCCAVSALLPIAVGSLSRGLSDPAMEKLALELQRPR